MTTFKNLHLNEKILNALEKKGYTIPTPIQLQAIPFVMEGKDILGIAQTGTGKTAAFSLPILHNLAKNPVSVKSGGVRVLILTPTRELASQIADNIELYGKDLGLRYAVIFGGVSERPQITSIKAGVDILIATPGRLLDLTSQGHIRYMQLEVLVLDEADRMLDMGFINDIKKIIQKIPEKRQTIFFSATMPATITGLANSILKNPAKIEVTPQSTTVERIDQKVLFVEKTNKPLLLKRLLKDETLTSALVFSKTKHGANKVVEFLEKNSVSVAAIHGNKSQGAREKALASFRAGSIKVLVATDIAARGIDIPAISHVINYDVPVDPESYVHRIGRTARAGLKGVAITFCDPSEVKYLREVEKVIKIKIPTDESHPFHGVEAAPAERSQSREPRPSSGNSREPRKYGFAVNKARKISENTSRKESDDRRAPRDSSSRSDDRRPSRASDRNDDRRPSSRTSDSRNDDRRSAPRTSDRSDDRRTPSRDNRGNDDRRSSGRDDRGSDYRKDFRTKAENIEKKKIFGLFGFGKSKSDSSSRTRPQEGSLVDRTRSGGKRDDRKSQEGFNSSFGGNKTKKESFGFGWFKNKPTSGSSSRSSDQRGEKRSDDFGNRERKSSSDDFGNRARPSSSGAKKPYSSNSGSRNYAKPSGSRTPTKTNKW